MQIHNRLKQVDVRRFLLPKTIADRPTWPHRADFFFALLGNGSSFSALAMGFIFYYSGGAAVLLPFIFLLLCFAFPLNFLQVTVGQLTRRSAVECWEVLCPLLKGVGYGSLLLSLMTTWINNQMMGYCVFYFFSAVNSSGSNPPWLLCSNVWNTRDCNPPKNGFNATVTLGTESKSVEEFWLYRVNKEDPMSLSKDFAPSGPFNWQLVLSSLTGWCMACACVFGGIRVIGKAMYILVVLPLILGLALIIQLSQYDGAGAGIKYFLYPDVRSMAGNFRNGNLGNNLLFLFSIPSSSAITLASYNPFPRNSLLDSIGLAVIGVFSPIFYNAIIFSAFGILASSKRVAFYDVVQFGIMGYLKTIPEALGVLPSASEWTAVFFMMNFCIILSFQICLTENIVSSFLDIFGSHRWRKRAIATGVITVFGLTMILVTGTGSSRHIITFIDFHFANIFVVVYVLLFTVAAAFNFGSHRLVSFIGAMYDSVCCSRFLRAMWKYLIIIIGLVLILGLRDRFHYVNVFFAANEKVGGVVPYTDGMTHMANFLSVLPCLPIPVLIIVQFLRHKGGFRARSLKLVRPQWIRDQVTRMSWTKSWAPKVLQEPLESAV